VVRPTPESRSFATASWLSSTPVVDIFSFGVVLHEMLSGTRPFRGGSQPDVHHASLHEGALGIHGATSPELDLIVKRCPEKSAAERFETAQRVTLRLHWRYYRMTPANPRIASPKYRPWLTCWRKLFRSPFA
jgi:serine/threonine-protein kinase